MITARYFDVMTGRLETIQLISPYPILYVPVRQQGDPSRITQHREFTLGHSPLRDKDVYDYYVGRDA